MNDDLLKINPSAEKYKIISFIKTVLKKQGFEKVVVGLSGGIDSATSFYLLKEIVKPQNIFVAHLYYFESQIDSTKKMLSDAKVPNRNIFNISIKNSVDAVEKTLNLDPISRDYKIRLGNIMARIRMIALFDIAKRNNSLVCGTENKSEHLLGYFTRFGDEASDIEPIQHLYKTQIYELANYLGIPKEIIQKAPSANLWQTQTDEGEFDFTYKEADQVLFYYYDKKLKLDEIKNKGFANAEKIVTFSLKNSYKHHTPYAL